MPDIDISHGGLVLVALLSGGDYHQAGLAGCGPKVAHGLAKCGFGDSLLSAARNLSGEGLRESLVTWKKDLAEELRTNSRGILGRKYHSLSKAIPEEFPDVAILMSYVSPVTSETEGKVHKIKATWERPLDLGRIAHICELYFEWGVRHLIIKRFRTVIWPAAVLRLLRESVLEQDSRSTGRASLPGTTQPSQNEPPSSSPATSAAASLSDLRIGGLSICQDLILKIHSTRNHDSTDGLLEYRLEVSPKPLVALASAGIKDIRPPLIGDISSDDTTSERDKQSKKPPPDPSSHLRVWIPAYIVKAAMPSLVESFDENAKRKAARKNTRTKPIAGSTTPEDAEIPQNQEPPPKPNLKTFYPVKKPEQKLKSLDNHPKDHHTSGGQSKILSLIDDLAATGTSKHCGAKALPITTANEGSPSTIRRTTRKTADKEEQSRPPSRVPVQPGQEPTLLQNPSVPQDTGSDDVIEISSDSDEGEPPPFRTRQRVAPLLVARSRRQAQSRVPDDIIDLT